MKKKIVIAALLFIAFITVGTVTVFAQQTWYLNNEGDACTIYQGVEIVVAPGRLPRQTQLVAKNSNNYAVTILYYLGDSLILRQKVVAANSTEVLGDPGKIKVSNCYKS